MVESNQREAAYDHFVWRPVPFTDVVIDDAFWARRLHLNRERTMPFLYQRLVDTGQIGALRLSWKPGDEPVPHPFWCSGVAKWIEAASYILALHPDLALDARVDDVIALLAAAQQPDGYLNVYFTVVKPGERWTDLRDAHEIYCAGLLIEAGVAHYQATGKRTLLEVVRRFADHIGTVFGREPGQKRGYCGHEEIELALVKLYRATGEERYLHLAQYFVDERGRRPYYFELERAERGTPGFFEALRLFTSPEYNQAHLPVREQTEVVGHAVRAMYLYSAMADLAGETRDATLGAACRRLWDHLTTRRLYLTGGVGSGARHEGFTQDYDLPNAAAYCETCAAIGLVFWAHRMVQLEPDARYVDVLERALYNGVISGVSLDGTNFFYDNPLASAGDKHRKEWFKVACCPPNLARLLASLGQYIYSASDTTLAIHLYIQGHARVAVGGALVTVRQETTYPWDGAVTVTLEVDRPATFELRLRLPGWCRQARLGVDGEVLDLRGRVAGGYISLDRTWRGGERVQLDLTMPVERVYAHPRVAADAGCVALQRGPLIYCLEGADNREPLHEVRIPRRAAFSVRFEPELLGGVAVVTGDVRIADEAGWDSRLYGADPAALRPHPITAIPYYAWDNRQPGEMLVWLPEAEG
jgi:DUF1680 family protein